MYNLLIFLYCLAETVPPLTKDCDVQKINAQDAYIAIMFKTSNNNDPEAILIVAPLASKTPTLAAGGHKEAATATPTIAVFSPLTMKTPAAKPLAIATTISPIFGKILTAICVSGFEGGTWFKIIEGSKLL